MRASIGGEPRGGSLSALRPDHASIGATASARHAGVHLSPTTPIRGRRIAGGAVACWKPALGRRRPAGPRRTTVLGQDGSFRSRGGVNHHRSVGFPPAAPECSDPITPAPPLQRGPAAIASGGLGFGGRVLPALGGEMACTRPNARGRERARRRSTIIIAATPGIAALSTIARISRARAPPSHYQNSS